MQSVGLHPHTSSNLQEGFNKRDQRNNSLNGTHVYQSNILQPPNTVQQPSTQKLYNKITKFTPAIHAHGVGSGQSVFTHVGQNTLMNNATAFSKNSSANPSKKGTLTDGTTDNNKQYLLNASGAKEKENVVSGQEIKTITIGPEISTSSHQQSSVP